jgi:hypothetical protein
MDRHRKIAIAIVLIGVIAISASLVWLTEADIRYGFNMDYEFQMKDGQWVTVNWIDNQQMNGTFVNIECGNRGYSSGSFSLIVTFTNATFSATAEPYEQINSTTAKISYTLAANEARSTNVYFTINDGVKSFLVSVWFESGQVFQRSTESNWLGINTLDYELQPDGQLFAANSVM